MKLTSLFLALADALDGKLEIERLGASELRKASEVAEYKGVVSPLGKLFIEVMALNDAHPVCKLISNTPLHWRVPQTSNDPEYIKHSFSKVHVELLGPGGLMKSERVRLGLYGMLPNAEYGIRTHPAEEVFVMLAGEADWKRGDEDYIPHGPGTRSHHPSMMPHAQRTRNKAFMSVYVWAGDISTENYVYEGIPS